MKAFKQFDLPVKHLAGEGNHYVSPKAREAGEIERRKRLVSGVLMAEMQATGIKIAKNILEIMQAEEDTMFVTRTLGASAINTAWYNYAAGAKNVMRRTLSLQAYEDLGQEITTPNLIGLAAGQISTAERSAANLVKDGHEKRKLYVKHKKIIGATLGSAALVLANAPHAEVIAYFEDPALKQLVARQSALELLEDSRTLHLQVGSNPTLAQLSDKDSPLSVYWRRHAPDVSYEALEQAIEF
ncbi:MAG TPA: hypothetical protein VMR51_01955 [Patescibacteria group bacterium]|nr:hypothetical protein [Patescibacteria group bacterium]